MTNPTLLSVPVRLLTPLMLALTLALGACDDDDPAPAAAAPTLTGVAAANVVATAAAVNLTSSAAGMAYVAVLANAATAPAAAAVKAAAAGTAGVVAAAKAAVTAGMQATVPLTGLTASTMYDAFVVVEATSGGFSAVMKVDVDTLAAATVAPDLSDVTDTFSLTADTAPAMAIEFTNAVAATGGQLNEDGGCKVAPDLPTGMVLSRTADTHGCRIAGTPTQAIYDTEFTVTAENAIGMDASPATVTIGVAPAEVACTQNQAAPSGTAYPIGMHTHMNSPLFFRGNHSGWAPARKWQLIYKGTESGGTGGVYQVSATAVASEYAMGTNPDDTQFKIASNDGDWTTQFVSLTDASDTSSLATGIALGSDLIAYQVGTGGLANNMIDLDDGKSYVVTYTSNSPTDLMVGTGAVVNRGTLRIEECTAP